MRYPQFLLLGLLMLAAVACGAEEDTALTPAVTPSGTPTAASTATPTAMASPSGSPTATPTAPATHTATPASAGELRWTVEDAKQFKEFPLYWLGESYEGMPLTKIIRYRYDPEPPIPPTEAENIVLFIYGSCTPGPESGCAPPLSIRVEPYCMKPPERFAPAVRGEPLEVRGAPAEQISGDLRIWTGEVSIKIFTDGLAAQVEAAEKLRLISEGPEGAQSTLGPPDVRCQD
jgi:hypothetical protein